MTQIRLRTDAGTPRAPFVLIGGIPGAGKSTALQRLEPLVPGIRILDSETERRWFARHTQPLPYRLVRPVVHLVHHIRVLVLLLAGPGEGGAVVVHDPSTRWVRLGLVGRLARVRGWDPEVVFVDVSRAAALAGQQQRRRLVDGRRFAGHWRRWVPLRAALDPRSGAVAPRWSWALAPWHTRQLTSRTGAVRDLLEALAAAASGSSIRSPAHSVGDTLSNGG